MAEPRKPAPPITSTFSSRRSITSALYVRRAAGRNRLAASGSAQYAGPVRPPVDGKRRWPVPAVALALAVMPLCAFEYIRRFAVDVPYHDEFNFLILPHLADLRGGRLS